MNQILPFVNKYQQILDTHFVKNEDVDYSVLDYHLPLLKQLDAIENSSVVLFDFLKRKYQFLTARFKFLIGYDRDTALSEGPEYFLKQIHPDDLPKIIETMSAVMEFLCKAPVEDRKNYKLCFSFRIRHANGTYIAIVQQVILLELDKKGTPWIALITNDLLSINTPDTAFRRFFLNLTTSEYALFVPEEQGEVTKKSDLTTREVEVLGLMAKGLLSKQIADTLYISINTVNNHRANILRKMGAVNTAEAVRYATRLGLT